MTPARPLQPDTDRLTAARGALVRLSAESRLWLALVRHAALLWRSGLLRFRLETFGTYYPATPYASPSWRLHPRYALLLLRRARSYGRWLVEMDRLRASGARDWWRARGVPAEGIEYD